MAMSAATRSAIATLFSVGGKYATLPTAGFYSGITGTEQIHHDLLKLAQACYLANQTFDYSAVGGRRPNLIGIAEAELEGNLRAYIYVSPPAMNNVITQTTAAEDNGICGFPSAALATALTAPAAAALISSSVYAAVNFATTNPCQLLLDGFKAANESDSGDVGATYSQRVRVSIGEQQNPLRYRTTINLLFSVSQSLIFQPADVEDYA